MKFRTEIKISDAPRNLSPERLVLLMGSCFSDNIGERMVKTGWPVVVNPCGVVYNPVSMAILFRLAMTHRPLRREIVAGSIVPRDNRFVSWFMGGKASGNTQEECADAVCECLDRLEEGIEEASSVILTFGTSDVWLLKGTDRAVGNCHKYPQSEFDKRRISVTEMSDLWKEIINLLRQRNPEVDIIVTVSPRRYLSEGFADNSRLKSILILGCEELCKTVPRLTYFPAYEILNDDLRDYRFYASDLLHPSDAAIEYIWEKFIETYLDDTGIKRLREMEKESKKERHTPNL